MSMYMDTSAFQASVAAHLKAVDVAVPLVVNVAVVDIQRDAKRECPVDTGALRQSIGTMLAGTKPLPKNTGAVIVEMPYAPYVHDGTSKMAARPFLDVAVHKNRPKFLKQLAIAMRGGA